MTDVRQRADVQHRREGAGAGTLSTFVPLRLKRHGVKKVVVHAEPADLMHHGQVVVKCIDATLVKAIAQGLYWQMLLHTHQAADAAAIAKREGIDRARVTKLTRLALLAPDLIEAVVEGHLAISLQRLLREDIPRDWQAQRAWVAEER